MLIRSRIDRYLHFLFRAGWLSIRSALSTISDLQSALWVISFELLCNLGGLLIVIPVVFEEVGPALEIPGLGLLDIAPLRISDLTCGTLLPSALVGVVWDLFTITDPVLKVEAWIFGRRLEMLSDLPTL